MTIDPLIEVNNLSKKYEEGETYTPALNDVTFSIHNGEFVSIMGPSGSGKSTLLHILGFLDRQTSGIYKFDGRSIESYTDEELARVRNQKMGFVFQAFNLLARATVLENVRLPLLYSDVKESMWDKKAKQAVEAVGLGHRMYYDVAKLSGGEKQRTAIARALVNDPQVIFADEPTGNLDSKTGHGVIRLLQELNTQDKHTIIMVTHEMDTAEHAERIIRIVDGKIESDTKVKQRRAPTEFHK